MSIIFKVNSIRGNSSIAAMAFEARNVEVIRSSPLSGVQLAQAFGVAPSVISGIRRGRGTLPAGQKLRLVVNNAAPRR
jgi:hypothetical protein